MKSGLNEMGLSEGADLGQLGEKEVLRRLTAHWTYPSSVFVGVGDDCAVVERNEEWDTLLKTDVVVEGVHFLAEHEPFLIGRKALARAISDIASMGGLPEYALITVLADKAQPWQRLAEVYAGLDSLAKEWGVSLVGGETSSLCGKGLVLNISLMGRVEKGQAILRSGGKEGQGVWVSGLLGDSFHSGHHFSFTPRVAEGRFLQKRGGVGAMMDLSDGLAQDLPRLLRASGVDFVGERSLLPVREGASGDSAWAEGEDYELLFTYEEEGEERLLLDWQEAFPQVALTKMGVLVPEGAEGMFFGQGGGAGGCLEGASLSRPFSGGFEHFSS